MSYLPKWMPQWAEKKPPKRRFVVALCIVILIIPSYLLVCRIPDQESDIDQWIGTFHPSKRYDITGKHGAVASDNLLCSQMGVDVMRRGGTAADAAVQVALCIGSTTPQSSGIGGGGFITLRFPNGTAFTIDCRESAPESAHKHMYDANPLLSKLGGLASGVPGELAGINELWKMAGTLKWPDLVNPIAELNDRGFYKSEALKEMMKVYEDAVGRDAVDELMQSSDWCWLFGDHEQCNTPPDQVDFIVRPQLARTLREIAIHGIDVFYQGEIAEHLANLTQNNGGILTVKDFADYKVEVKPALVGKFRNMDVITAPAPASGPAMLMALNVMDELLVSPGPPAMEAEFDPVLNQQIVETMKWMAAARSELGDPNHISNPKIHEMLGVDWTAKVVSKINVSQTLPSWRDYHPSYEMNNPKGTTHFSVVDRDGMAVSMTTTVNLPFGNFLCCPHTGVIMNSEMDDFSVPNNNNSFELAPSIYNFVAPGKRPLSSAVPTIIVDPDTGKVDMVVGAAGGSRILTSVFLALVRVYGIGLDGLQAVSFPRYHHQLIPEELMLESGFNSERIAAWESRKHVVSIRNQGSVMNIVHRERGKLHALGDFYRKRGMGAAY